jgi:hypothetical protein
MLAKLKSLFALLRHGEEVADAGKWKKRQITVAMLVSLFGASVAALRAFGIDLETNEVQLEAVALGVLSIYGFVEMIWTAVTSKRAGVLPAKPDQPQ